MGLTSEASTASRYAKASSIETELRRAVPSGEMTSQMQSALAMLDSTKASSSLRNHPESIPNQTFDSATISPRVAGTMAMKRVDKRAIRRQVLCHRPARIPLAWCAVVPIAEMQFRLKETPRQGLSNNGVGYRLELASGERSDIGSGDRVLAHVRPTYRRSAAGARGSAATDKPVCCNALLGGRPLLFGEYSTGRAAAQRSPETPSFCKEMNFDGNSE